MSACVPEGVYVMPAWSGVLRNLYWHVRYYGGRYPARRLALYRKILKEKRALVASGVDPEHIRLVCLSLADPSRERRIARCIAFEAAIGALSRAQRGANVALVPAIP